MITLEMLGFSFLIINSGSAKSMGEIICQEVNLKANAKPALKLADRDVGAPGQHAGLLSFRVIPFRVLAHR